MSILSVSMRWSIPSRAMRRIRRWPTLFQGRPSKTRLCPVRPPFLHRFRPMPRWSRSSRRVGHRGERWGRECAVWTSLPCNLCHMGGWSSSFCALHWFSAISIQLHRWLPPMRSVPYPPVLPSVPWITFARRTWAWRFGFISRQFAAGLSHRFPVTQS